MADDGGGGGGGGGLRPRLRRLRGRGRPPGARGWSVTSDRDGMEVTRVAGTTLGTGEATASMRRRDEALAPGARPCSTAPAVAGDDAVTRPSTAASGAARTAVGTTAAGDTMAEVAAAAGGSCTAAVADCCGGAAGGERAVRHRNQQQPQPQVS